MRKEDNQWTVFPPDLPSTSAALRSPTCRVPACLVRMVMCQCIYWAISAFTASSAAALASRRRLISSA